MNYLRIYNDLILKRIDNIPVGYTENHHIQPKCLGGSDDKDNLVRLTGREHWVAHLLLHKIHNKRETAFACHMMTMRCEERGIPEIKNSRMYEYIRIQHAKYIGKIFKKSQSGEGNSQYGKMWICNVESKQNTRISKTDSIPEGWIKGRNKWNVCIKKKYISKISDKIFLSSPYYITNGMKNKFIQYEDDIIPSGWYIGVAKRTLSNETLIKLSNCTKISNKNRIGIKYKKIK